MNNLFTYFTPSLAVRKLLLILVCLSTSTTWAQRPILEVFNPDPGAHEARATSSNYKSHDYYLTVATSVPPAESAYESINPAYEFGYGGTIKVGRRFGIRVGIYLGFDRFKLKDSGGDYRVFDETIVSYQGRTDVSSRYVNNVPIGFDIGLKYHLGSTNHLRDRPYISFSYYFNLLNDFTVYYSLSDLDEEYPSSITENFATSATGITLTYHEPRIFSILRGGISLDFFYSYRLSELLISDFLPQELPANKVGVIFRF